MCCRTSLRHCFGEASVDGEHWAIISEVKNQGQQNVVNCRARDTEDSNIITFAPFGQEISTQGYHEFVEHFDGERSNLHIVTDLDGNVNDFCCCSERLCICNRLLGNIDPLRIVSNIRYQTRK